eukprot:Gb_38366 [translate_table: standard]
MGKSTEIKDEGSSSANDSFTLEDILQTEAVITLNDVIQILKLHGVDLSTIYKNFVIINVVTQEDILKRLNYVGMPHSGFTEKMGFRMPQENIDQIDSSSQAQRQQAHKPPQSDLNSAPLETPFPRQSDPPAGIDANENKNEHGLRAYFKSYRQADGDIPLAHACVVTKLECSPRLTRLKIFYARIGVHNAILGKGISPRGKGSDTIGLSKSFRPLPPDNPTVNPLTPPGQLPDAPNVANNQLVRHGSRELLSSDLKCYSLDMSSSTWKASEGCAENEEIAVENNDENKNTNCSTGCISGS